MRALAIKSARVAISFLIFLAAGEIAIRIVHRFTPIYSELGVAHPLFNHWHRPNFERRTHRSRSGYGETVARPHRTLLRTNEHGMMGAAVSLRKTQGSFRIAVLGDSFVEGRATEENETLTAYLEEFLNETSDANFEVLNFGCSGYSPGTEYFNLVHLASRFEPDMVILVFHFTDVTNDWHRRHAAVRDASGEVVALDGTRGRQGLAYKLANRLLLFKVPAQMIGRTMRQRGQRRPLAPENQEDFHLTKTFYAIFKETYSKEDKAAWNLTLAYLSRTRAWCEKQGVPFLLVALPVGQQVEPLPAQADTRFDFRGKQELIRSAKMQDILAEWTDTEHVHFLDLLPKARAWRGIHPQDVLFFPMDGHLTPVGNRMASEAIFSRLGEENLLPLSSFPPKSPTQTTPQ